MRLEERYMQVIMEDLEIWARLLWDADMKRKRGRANKDEP